MRFEHLFPYISIRVPASKLLLQNSLNILYFVNRGSFNLQIDVKRASMF